MNNKAAIRSTFILFALVLSAAAQPHTITGKVVGVSDGETITALDDQKRQRLPETLAGLYYVAFVILMLKNVAEILA